MYSIYIVHIRSRFLILLGQFFNDFVYIFNIYSCIIVTYMLKIILPLLLIHTIVANLLLFNSNY